ncbi:MAG: TonB-dependent receptor plug domain-containing protein, partial [Flammeovirgaceae bacterium]
MLITATLLLSLFQIPYIEIYAQERSDTIPELEIWGFPEEKFAVGNTINHIDSGVLVLYGTQRLANVLQQTTPIYIRAYGPSNLASISFRGTGSNHTAVLWNGININSPTLGQSDFYNLPNLAFNEISIQHGGGSALYGTDAIGGSIQLGNHPTWKEGLSLSLQQSVGSFGRWQTALRGSYAWNNLEFATKIYRSKAENDFPFTNDQRIGSPRQNQQNAAYLQWGIVQDVFWDISSNDRLSVHFWYNNSDREIQPPMTRLEDNDRQKDENIRSLISYQHLSNWGTTTAKVSWIHDFMNFNDGATVDSRIAVNRFTGVFAQERRFSDKFETKLGAQITHFKTDVENYEAGTTESRLDLFWLSTFQATPKLKASLQLRQTLLKGFDPPFTPSLGLEYLLLEETAHQLKLKGNISRAYRVPTLNERFWQPGGNPDILPEESTGWEGGFQYQFIKKKLTIDFTTTYFHTTIENWVFWRPTPPSGNFSPQNVQKVRTRGIEVQGKLSAHYGKTKHLLGGNYAFTQATVLESDEPSTVNTSLFYVPQHKGNVYYHLAFKNYSFQSNLSSTSSRIAIARNKLDAFTVLDLSLLRKFTVNKTAIELQFMLNNALNADFQNYELYAQP